LAESDLLYTEATRAIIGAAMETHKILGAGFLESVYEESLAYEFELNHINFQRQSPINVIYKGKVVKQFICDFIIEDKILVEIKAVKKMSEIEYAQVINYLKATGIKVGLLINFGAASLEYKRFMN
jgi:GxxExxY protein